MKIMFFNWGPHHRACFDYLYNILKRKGYDAKIKNGWKEPIKIPKDIDIVFITSNRSRPVIEHELKVFLIPHGIGLESWEKGMEKDDIIFLNGNKPWTPPKEANNWKKVGWSKSDVLFTPEKETVDKVKEFMSSFPYDKTILFIPPLHPRHLDYIKTFGDFAKKEKLNLIVPFRRGSQGYTLFEAEKRYKGKYPHLKIPDVLNLYYFTPYLDLVIGWGATGVPREFYPTNIPTVHAGTGFEESYYSKHPIEEKLPVLVLKILQDPKAYLQPKNVIKDFFEFFDGKSTERIINEIDKV